MNLFLTSWYIFTDLHNLFGSNQAKDCLLTIAYTYAHYVVKLLRDILFSKILNILKEPHLWHKDVTKYCKFLKNQVVKNNALRRDLFTNIKM